MPPNSMRSVDGTNAPLACEDHLSRAVSCRRISTFARWSQRFNAVNVR
jgi:hypothetical protein